MLFLARIDCDIVILGVFTDDHSLVNLGLRTNKELTAILGVVKTVSCSNARLTCNKRTGKSHNYTAAVRLITVKESVKNTFSVSS